MAIGLGLQIMWQSNALHMYKCVQGWILTFWTAILPFVANQTSTHSNTNILFSRASRLWNIFSHQRDILSFEQSFFSNNFGLTKNMQYVCEECTYVGNVSRLTICRNDSSNFVWIYPRKTAYKTHSHSLPDKLDIMVEDVLVVVLIEVESVDPRRHALLALLLRVVRVCWPIENTDCSLRGK